MWSVNLTNYGANIAEARVDLHAAEQSLRTLPGLLSAAAFEEATEGTSVIFDTREQTGSMLCGIYRIVTIFRIGGAVLTTMEEYWNETPVRMPFLAHLLATQFGYTSALEGFP